jgi:pimeloyl-ACP methyl ester carboxylesterase
MFQSPRWLETLKATPGCQVHAMAAGHWLMLDKPAEYSAHLLQWLDNAAPKTATY